MALVIIPNNSEADGPLEAPSHEDGRPFQYCMYFHDYYDVAFADTYDDLLEALIPGYQQLTEEQAIESRILLGVSAASQIQAQIVAESDLSSVTEDQYKTLMAPRIAPSLRADWWTCPIPLVVVETAYQPYTDVPRPTSGISDTEEAPNLLWVRPAEEEEFLRSLHEIGYIRLMEATPAD